MTAAGTTFANGLTVAPATVASIETAPNIASLLAEYAGEGLIAGLPPPAAKWDTYRALEAAGLLQAFAATVGGELVGFITVLTATLPRHARPLATSESFFVAAAHRGTGAGRRLLRAAETRAREAGALGLLVGAPAGGRLAEVLPRSGYIETNRVFFRSLADGN